MIDSNNRKIVSSHIMCFYSFSYSGKASVGERSEIWDRICASNYFLQENVDSLVGDVKELTLEPVAVHLNPDAPRLIDAYSRRGFVGDIKIENLRLKPIAFKILLLQKWNVGLVVLSIRIDVPASVNETILVERMFSYRTVRNENSIFLSSSRLSITNVVLDCLRKLHDKYGITVSSTDNEVLGSVYYFTLLKAENLVEKEKLGVLTRTIDYLKASDKDAHRIGSSLIDVDNRNKLYLGPYSGGVISRTLSGHSERFQSSLMIVLMIMRGLTRRVLNDAIERISAKESIRKIEQLLREIASLNMLLTPNTITGAYKFNSEILPSFLQATSIDKVRDNLENMLRVFQDTLDRQRNRRRNMLLMYLSLLATAFAVVQFIRTLLFR